MTRRVRSRTLLQTAGEGVQIVKSCRHGNSPRRRSDCWSNGSIDSRMLAFA